MDSTVEEIAAALENKNPNIRSETALFLARTFAKTNPNLVNKKLLKQLITPLLKVNMFYISVFVLIFRFLDLE